MIDSSVVVAILFDEPEARSFLTLIAMTDPCRISAAGFVEISIVLRRGDPEGMRRRAFGEMLRLFSIRVEPVTEAQARLAVDAFERFGKGTGHPAGLNFGDCFSYALARAVDEPLLFKGDDFSRTDIAPAT